LKHNLKKFSQKKSNLVFPKIEGVNPESGCFNVLSWPTLGHLETQFMKNYNIQKVSMSDDLFLLLL
jgi:hypothetical protein